MARIKVDGRPGESTRDRLLREGRIEIRKDMERRFHSRTDAWRKTHEHIASPGEVRVGPPLDLDQEV